MAMNYTGIGHIALRCKNYKNMHEFYTQKLGFEELFHLNKEDGSLWLTYIRVSKGQFLELFPEEYEGDNKPENRSHHHFCLEVGNFAETVRLLESRGIAVHSGPVACYPRMTEPFEAREASMCGSLCAFIADPEGNDIEIMQFTPESMQINCDK
jgi:lactoylglutathione lyase